MTARTFVAALVAVMVAPPALAGGVAFEGPPADPRVCVGEGDGKRCCGHLSGKESGKAGAAGKGPKATPCRGPEFLHPAMASLARCLVEKLHVTSNPDVCDGGLRESFRTMKLQGTYKSIPGGLSFHNWGLAMDICSYFKSGDCSQANLVNKVLGGVMVWKSGQKVKCQAAYRKKGTGGSDVVSAKVLAGESFPDVLAAVKSCYEDGSVPFGAYNWGVFWKDYFDGPHFQYFASPSAGYYEKKKAMNGPHVLMRVLSDCYSGDRASMLADLYATPDPADFVRARADGCGAKAATLFDDYLETAYPGGFLAE